MRSLVFLWLLFFFLCFLYRGKKKNKEKTNKMVSFLGMLRLVYYFFLLLLLSLTWRVEAATPNELLASLAPSKEQESGRPSKGRKNVGKLEEIHRKNFQNPRKPMKPLENLC